MKKAGEIHIVLDCSTEKIQSILKQASQVGMMTAYHNYLITSLVSLTKPKLFPFLNFESYNSAVVGVSFWSHFIRGNGDKYIIANLFVNLFAFIWKAKARSDS